MSENSVIEIEACNKSVKFREKLFALFDFKTKTEYEKKEAFDNLFQSLKNRGELEFPEIKTKHKLLKETSMGEVYSLSKSTYENIVLFIHGGAFVYNISDSQVKFCDKIVKELDAKVYMPMYPLAPQFNYKDVYEMVESVYDELLKEDKPIIVMGDSAGGTITLGLTFNLIKKGKRLPKKIVPISPCVDGTFTSEHIKEFEARDGMLSLYDSLIFSQLFADGDDIKTPGVSPIYGDFNGFPDTLLFAATYDLLGADDIELYKKMCKSDMNVKLVKGNGFWHVFPFFEIKEQKFCVDLIKEFCK